MSLPGRRPSVVTDRGEMMTGHVTSSLAATLPLAVGLSLAARSKYLTVAWKRGHMTTSKVSSHSGVRDIPAYSYSVEKDAIAWFKNGRCCHPTHGQPGSMGQWKGFRSNRFNDQHCPCYWASLESRNSKIVLSSFTLKPIVGQCWLKSKAHIVDSYSR